MWNIDRIRCGSGYLSVMTSWLQLVSFVVTISGVSLLFHVVDLVYEVGT